MVALEKSISAEPLQFFFFFFWLDWFDWLRGSNVLVTDIKLFFDPPRRGLMKRSQSEKKRKSLQGTIIGCIFGYGVRTYYVMQRHLRGVLVLYYAMLCDAMRCDAPQRLFL